MISGSLRRGSVNSAVLKTARALAAPPVIAHFYERLGDLPHFNPDDDREPLAEAVAHLRAEFAACDAVLFSTPEYAGALPGSFKNLLDWTVGQDNNHKPVGWINASMGGAKGTYEQLRTVLTYANADVVADACAEIPVPRNAIDGDGLVAGAGLRQAISSVLEALATCVAERQRGARTRVTPLGVQARYVTGDPLDRIPNRPFSISAPFERRSACMTYSPGLTHCAAAPGDISFTPQ
jgi:NAD(P)H-dependent FMN reductase